MVGLLDRLDILAGSAWPLAVTAIAILLSSAFYLYTSFFQKMPAKERPLRHLTLRIDGIPIDTSDETLNNELKTMTAQDPGLRDTVYSVGRITPRDSQWACATATFHTSIPEAELVRRLQQASGIPTYKYDSDFYGITPLYIGVTRVDVDHAVGSWKSPSSSDIWLRDYLPTDIPNARICGIGLISRQSTNPPIIFIGHSLGGLLVKEALLYARKKSSMQANLELTRACCGLLFFGVPNLGLRNEQLQSLVHGRPNEKLIQALIVDRDSEPSDYLARISDDFSKQCKGEYQVVSFFETKYSPTVLMQADGRITKTGPQMLLVTQKSATSTGLTAVADEDNISLYTDHSGMVKYDSNTRGIYPVVRQRLEAIVAKDVPRVTRSFRDNVLAESPQAEKCHSDLFETDPFEDMKSLQRKKGDRAKGTCEWILETEELASWLGPERAVASTNVLWLHGNPGTGKSTIAICLAEVLREKFRNTDHTSLSYFFCDSSFDTRRSVTSVVRGLILQLIQQHPRLLLDYLLPKYRERGKKIFDSFDALWAVLHKMAADRATGHKFFIIDALDECDGASQQILMKQLQQEFQHESFASNIRLLITSRPYPEIQERLKLFSNKDLASFPESKRDIHRFVGEKVAELAARKQYTARVKKQITDILEEKSERTFLWVGLACEELDQIPSKNAVDHLKKIPSGLNALYKRLLDNALNAPGQNAKVVKQILASQLAAACQTYLDEDQETRIQFTRDDITTCRLLVVIQDQKVLLLHQTVKDFLSDSAQRLVQKADSHAEMAYKCVDQLIRDYELVKDHPHWEEEFSSYASDYWDSHARLAGVIFEVKQPRQIFFEVMSPCRDAWLYRAGMPYIRGVRLPSQASILHIAGYCRIPAIFDYLCNSPHRQMASDIKAILESDDSSERNPLSAAAIGGNEIVITQLLEYKAYMSIKMVKAAAGNNWNGKEVMALLFDQRGDEVSITEDVVKVTAKN
ncbi:vegetative incompatibility protein HET-E-1 [Xylariomycetidae sp. FL2044]|nr:vegetative incompatibility protein HET-E-1 [Xylariomycetidae sp. FL2044]